MLRSLPRDLPRRSSPARRSIGLERWSNRTLALGVGALWSATAAGSEVSPPAVPAIRWEGPPPVIDGRLDEAAWSDAARVTGVGRVSPVEDGRPGYGSSEFFVSYDRSALYVAARVVQPPEGLRANISPRDELFNDDSVMVFLKPIVDGPTGYIFRINPLGIQRDGLSVGYTGTYPSWDGIWQSAGRVHEAGGYTVEIRIPFRTLRFTSDPSQTWGIGFGLVTGVVGEYALWPPFSSNRGHQFDQLGTLEGLEDLKRGLNLELVRERGRSGQRDH